MNANAKRYLENWQNEVDSAAQYRFLAENEKDENISRVYRRLGRIEEEHVAFWENQLRRAGETPPPRQPSRRSRALIFLAKHVSPTLVLSTIAEAERVDRNSYVTQPETAPTPMASQERWHARVLRELLRTQRRGLQGNVLGRLEGRHRAVGGNALRAAVLGANDGLCSNLSLVMGVAGASASGSQLLLTGIAGLLAGAFSMALGEFLSVASARELAEREIRIEADELETDLQGEGKELQLIYEAKGLSQASAREMARQLLTDKSKALDALTREELGIDPAELGGSPWEAATVSFALFSLGALIPVLPFFFLHGRAAVPASAALSALALFGIGAAITLFTSRPVWRSGLRQLALGLLAAGITFGLGRLIGAAIA